ncbi:coiled-coil domain-containing protein 40-like isoform X2 [Mizuhopecten yessoensis]|uniref:coiled-coil domain-containing protein 40-like isoform X2 n=1 Tax=Mizuhopecten yessoensis TaxID=6573 RepID=UPI000B457B55|nr:coiled-coil domain-containing protein 40-like isoform X2 [Mizuhopecten yessoensis]
MADQEERPPSGDKPGIENVVTDATIKALQEFDTGEMEQTGEPPAAKETEEGDRPVSAKSGSRPMSARPGSKSGSRPTSAKPASPAGSGRASVTGDRPPSASRPASGHKAPSQTGSRPTSAAKQEGSRPTSAKSRSKPTSAKFVEQPPVSATVPEVPVSATVPEVPVSVTVPVVPDDELASPQHGIKAPPQTAEGGQGFPTEPDTYQPPPQPQSTDYGALVQQAPGGYGGDGGDGGGDDRDSEGDDEDDEEMEDVGEGESEGSDEEGDMVVLDPDHPLMKRFQNALKSHLNNQNEKVSLELRELEEALRNRKKEREDLGVELYGVQQELARYQMMLEKHHDEYSQLAQARLQEEQQLQDVRAMYKESQTTVNKEKKKYAELQSEVENLALRLFYMQNAKEDVRSDIAIMRRAAEKAETEVSKSEIEKQKQDLFVDRLVERVDKLKEEIAMYEAQITAQTEETLAAQEALTEAHMEIEAIGLEKKQLFQQWNSSLIGMRRRDEAHSAMQEALEQQQQKVLSLETEIEGYKKSIFKEQEQNEKLTLILNKTERDIETVRKLLSQSQAKHDALKAEYATYTRMLHETEQALNRAVTDKTLRMNELNALRKQIEREYLEKVQLEDAIMEKMRSQLTMDKASQYTRKLTAKKRELTKQLETQMAEVENTISSDSLDISNVQTRIERLDKIMRGLDGEIAAKNDIINRSEAEIIKRNAVIERKQNIIDQYNKKLEVLITNAGGVELGPLEININSLQKSIEARLQEIAELQQLWLRQQTELVHLSKEKDSQSHSVEKLKKQLTILSQKKIRTEGNIDEESRETYDIERNITNMQNDMIKLNQLLHKETNIQSNLQQDNILLEQDFIRALKEAELDSIEKQANLDSIKEEKERLLNSLVEAERQIMLWEKKTQLARETRAAVDSEVGQGEIKAMNAEIHRMTVRHTQLMKQQEKMIQEMEKAVSRRDTIVTRGDAQQKTNKNVLTKGTFERQMAELRKKIKHTIQEANSCDGEIQDLRDHQLDLSSQLEQNQVTVQHLQSNSDTMDGDIERLLEVKQKNMTEILEKQQKTKYFQQAKDGKYTMLCKSESSLENESTKQVDRMQALSAIVDRLNQEYPHVQPAMRRVTLALSARADVSED